MSAIVGMIYLVLLGAAPVRGEAVLLFCEGASAAACDGADAAAREHGLNVVARSILKASDRADVDRLGSVAFEEKRHAALREAHPEAAWVLHVMETDNWVFVWLTDAERSPARDIAAARSILSPPLDPSLFLYQGSTGLLDQLAEPAPECVGAAPDRRPLAGNQIGNGQWPRASAVAERRCAAFLARSVLAAAARSKPSSAEAARPPADTIFPSTQTAR